jgi:hypothetical protein
MSQVRNTRPSGGSAEASTAAARGSNEPSAEHPVPIATLVPNLDAIGELSQVRDRFAAAVGAYRAAILGPKHISEESRVKRAFEFFTLFAERFVKLANQKRPFGLGGPGEGSYSASQVAMEVGTFSELLKQMGFGSIKDAASGKDGVTCAFELLNSHNMDEFDGAAAKLDMRPNYVQGATTTSQRTREPMPRLNGDGSAPKTFTELGESPPELDGKIAQQRISGQLPVALQPLTPPREEPPPPPPPPETPTSSSGGNTEKGLGPRLFWNILHRFRPEKKEDTAVEKGRWDRLAFAALLLLGFLVAVVVIVVNL